MEKSVARYVLGLCLALGVGLAQAGESTNRMGITMVDIPGGSFIMGSCLQNKREAFLGESSCANPDPEARDDETPQHRVSVSGFQMGKTEVTLGQFKAFIKAAGRADLVDDDFIKHNDQGDSAAVVKVSWNDAQAFIDWLNGVDGGGYRLPSEAEWEYACRAGGNAKYCGGNDPNTVAWHDGNSGGRVHPVAGKKPNGFGLYDMSGNVWEWTQDCWHNSYQGAPSNGSAWTGNCSSEGRVLRGGSWFSTPWYARAAGRGSVWPGFRYKDNGFRLARTR